MTGVQLSVENTVVPMICHTWAACPISDVAGQSIRLSLFHTSSSVLSNYTCIINGVAACFTFSATLLGDGSQVVITCYFRFQFMTEVIYKKSFWSRPCKNVLGAVKVRSYRVIVAMTLRELVYSSGI